MLYQSNSKGKKESALLRAGLSCASSRLPGWDLHYFQFKIITFLVQDGKVFKVGRVVVT